MTRMPMPSDAESEALPILPFFVASERCRSSTIRASASEAPRSFAVSSAHAAMSFICDTRVLDDTVPDSSDRAYHDFWRRPLMYFEQFYLGCLAHASYFFGSQGEAVVVDPQRDVEIYLEAAQKHGLTIRHIVETHLHADFVSGHKELAARTGATIYIGKTAGATFPHVPVGDGFELRVGNVRVQGLETPGHTPESCCFV